MKRVPLLMLSWASMLICGCAGRIDADLLQARIREQAAQLTESQREIAKTRSDLKRSRLEADQLKSELTQVGRESATQPSLPISKLRIHSLASGGLNKDDQPGDDIVVVQFVPINTDNQPSQVPADLEFTLFDPLLPEMERELGRWNFSAEECRTHWTRGITSSGFQFSLPLENPPQHTDLVVHVQYRTSNDCRLELSHVVKVVPAGINAVQTNARVRLKRPRPNPVRTVDESDAVLPPVGDIQANCVDSSDSDWASDEFEQSRTTPGRAVLHSSNWTDATIPQLR